MSRRHLGCRRLTRIPGCAGPRSATEWGPRAGYPEPRVRRARAASRAPRTCEPTKVPSASVPAQAELGTAGVIQVRFTDHSSGNTLVNVITYGIRLYSQEDFEARSEFTEPEILRTNLASVILQMTSLGLADIAGARTTNSRKRHTLHDTRSQDRKIARSQDRGAASRLVPGPVGPGDRRQWRASRRTHHGASAETVSSKSRASAAIPAIGDTFGRAVPTEAAGLSGSSTVLRLGPVGAGWSGRCWVDGPQAALNNPSQLSCQGQVLRQVDDRPPGRPDEAARDRDHPPHVVRRTVRRRHCAR